MEWLSRILDLAKVPTKFVAAVALFASLIMLLPKDALEALSLLHLREQYGAYVGVALLISAAILIIEICVWGYDRGRGYFLKKRLKQSVGDRLKTLDQSEKAVLREFYIAGSRTIKLPIEQPAVSALLNAGILEQATSLGSRTTVGSVFSLSLSDEAEKLVRPALLDFEGFPVHTEDGGWQVNEEGERWLMENRPSFMQELQRHLSLMEGRFW